MNPQEFSSSTRVPLLPRKEKVPPRPSCCCILGRVCCYCLRDFCVYNLIVAVVVCMILIGGLINCSNVYTKVGSSVVANTPVLPQWVFYFLFAVFMVCSRCVFNP